MSLDFSPREGNEKKIFISCAVRVGDPLLRGEKMTQEQLAALYRRVQITKAAQAHELLAKRGQSKEK